MAMISVSRFLRRNNKELKKYSPFSTLYEREYKRSLMDPEEFWAEAGESLVWRRKWDRVLEVNQGYNREWFKGGRMSISYNCIDRHIDEGRGDYLAVITDDPINKRTLRLTYSQLCVAVSKISGFLSRVCQHKKGERVVIYMPMIPECLVAMNACARLGLVHCVVFGGFSANQLALRIKHSQAKTLITVNYDSRAGKFIDYSAIVEEALTISNDQIENCLVFNRPDCEPFRNAKSSSLRQTTKFYDWNEELDRSEPHDPVEMDSNDPLYILHTSGTTGSPKGVVRSIGDYAVALNWSMKNIYACDSPSEIKAPSSPWWAASDFGWVVGHSYIVYGPLLAGVPTIIYQGKPVDTPDSSQYFRVLTEHRVKSCFITPSAVKAIRQQGDIEQSRKYLNYIGESLKNVFLAGEHCDRETFMWLRQILPESITISDHWWQTETGWPLTAPCMGLYTNEEKIGVPIGSTGKGVPGVELLTVDEGNPENNLESSSRIAGEEVKRILVKLPMPPGFTKGLWNEEDGRFHELYFKKFPGYYDTMDAGFCDENGNYFIISRSDDVINVSGHRLCTGSIEEACLTVEEVVECVVISIPHPLKGQEPMALVVLKRNIPKSEHTNVRSKVATAVRDNISPIASLSRVCIVPALPKTRSGKIARLSLVDMATGSDIQIPVTIESTDCYLPIYEEMLQLGLNPTRPPH